MGQNNGERDSKIQCFLKAVTVTVDAQDGLSSFYERLDYAKMLIEMQMREIKKEV